MIGGEGLNIEIWTISFLIVFMLHNLEEIITIEKWYDSTYRWIAKRFPKFLKNELDHFKEMTTAQFAIAVFVFSIFCSALLLISVVSEYHYYLFLGVNLLFAFNIFTHPLQSLFLKRYTPGLFTSLLLVLPYFIMFFYNFYNTELLSLETIIRGIFVMFILFALLIFSHIIGEQLQGFSKTK